MVAKASPVPAGSSAPGRTQTSDRIHRAAAARTRPAGDARCGTLATMRASARRSDAARAAEARPRKAKRAKRARSLGGRLAAAIRMARLRAHRAAEEHHGAKP
ncbi:MAG TPA: hypothetical protein VGU03_11285 [Frateuria sp.]|uniref:hypothetical protein n=1 Tax=Frateuria sp. TaxID=2211372 RepID=UPI002DEE8ADF|nr:hypothetical protein [Frateuria sp.]